MTVSSGGGDGSAAIADCSEQEESERSEDSSVFLLFLLLNTSLDVCGWLCGLPFFGCAVGCAFESHTLGIKPSDSSLFEDLRLCGWLRGWLCGGCAVGCAGVVRLSVLFS